MWHHHIHPTHQRWKSSRSKSAPPSGGLSYLHQASPTLCPGGVFPLNKTAGEWAQRSPPPEDQHKQLTHTKSTDHRVLQALALGEIGSHFLFTYILYFIFFTYFLILFYSLFIIILIFIYIYFFKFFVCFHFISFYLSIINSAACWSHPFFLWPRGSSVHTVTPGTPPCFWVVGGAI